MCYYEPMARKFGERVREEKRGTSKSHGKGAVTAITQEKSNRSWRIQKVSGYYLP